MKMSDRFITPANEFACMSGTVIDHIDRCHTVTVWRDIDGSFHARGIRNDKVRDFEAGSVGINGESGAINLPVESDKVTVEGAGDLMRVEKVRFPQPDIEDEVHIHFTER